MRKMLTGLLAVAIVVAAVVVAGVAADRLGTRSELATNSGMSRAAGMMPEVVSTAEMPRLTMSTVEVRAMRTVAMDGQSLFVN